MMLDCPHLVAARLDSPRLIHGEIVSGFEEMIALSQRGGFIIISGMTLNNTEEKGVLNDLMSASCWPDSTVANPIPTRVFFLVRSGFSFVNVHFKPMSTWLYPHILKVSITALLSVWRICTLIDSITFHKSTKAGFVKRPTKP